MSDSAPTPPEEPRRVADSLRRRGLDFALLASPTNVTYAAGVEAPIQVGPIWEVVSWLPLVLVLVSAEGDGIVIAADAYTGLADTSWFQDGTRFDSLGHVDELDPPTSFARALGEALGQGGLGAGRAVLGIEPALPRLAVELLASDFPAVELRDASPALEEARSIKTPREIALLREAALVASDAQTRLRDIASSPTPPGSDVDIWVELLGAMDARARRHLLVTGELVTGARTARVAPGGPIGAPITVGDTAILDISPRVDGYWADCTNTVVFGGAQPTDEQRRYFGAARESCEAAMATLRPGARCSDAHEAVRTTMERYGLPVAHYSGHQIGAGVNERPRLVPYDHTVIEPGMVFCVEPGAYEGEGGTTGARAEKTVLVAEDGPEIISQFEWGF